MPLPAPATPTRPGEVPRDPPPPEPEKAPEADKPDEAARLSALETQTKRAASERMKLAHEARKFREESAKEKEALAKEREELAAYKKEREDRRRNPEKYLAAEYGPDWYDKLSKVKLNGAPTPDLIASEVDDRVAAVRRELEEFKAETVRREENREKQAAAAERQAYEVQAIAYMKANEAKFPLVHTFGVQGNINAVIAAHFEETLSRGPDGEVIPGEVWSPEEAASFMEKALLERYEKAKAISAPKPAPKVVQADTRNNSPRRTLSTDMTATSTRDVPPAQDERERIRRAIAAADLVIEQRRLAH